MSIDRGLGHHRLIQNLVGTQGLSAVNASIDQIPPNTPEHVRQLQIDHIYVEVVVGLCSHLEVPSLSRMLAEGRGA